MSGTPHNCDDPRRKYPGTALDYAIGTYGRSAQLGACMDILVQAGGVTRYNLPPVLDLLRGRLDLVAQHLDAEPALLHRRFPELDFGSTGERRLKLRRATLLRVAAEYGNVEAARLFLDRGASKNTRAGVDEAGIGGQTPIFHAVTQFFDWGPPVAELLINRGADLSVRVRLPGHYERPDEVVECTPLGYALLFPGASYQNDTCVALLREHGGME